MTIHYTGSASGNGSKSSFKFKNPITLKAGRNEIALLSMTVGLQVSNSLLNSNARLLMELLFLLRFTHWLDLLLKSRLT